MNRRHFLESTLVGGASLLLPPATQAQVQIFPCGIASGDPAQNGIVLWTQVAVPPGGAQQIAWQISTSPAFSASSVILGGTAPIDPLKDNTVKVLVNSPRLQPFTLYYYRFAYGNARSAVGRFKTLPDPAANVFALRIGYISCQDYGNGYYTALAALAAENVDYIVHLGDYIYETIADPSFQNGQVRNVPLLPNGGLVAATVDDYRFLYRTYRSDPNLQYLHSQFAMIQIWDDHEFANDSYQDYHPDNNPNPSQPTPQLRQAANQAWSEYAVTSASFDPTLGPLQSIRQYRSFKFGRLADLVTTDLRLYRDGPPCGLAQAQRYLTKACPATNDPNRTMMQTTQKNWFLDKMTNSNATWKVWANEMMAMQFRALNLGPANSLYVTLDQWDGYPAERAAILQALSGTKNVVAITGDIHSFVAGYLKPDFDSTSSAPVAVEFVGGSVTSSNFSEILASARPSPSAPVPRSAINGPIDLLEKLVLLQNRHIKLFNSQTHGYCVLEMTPARLTCTMRSVDTVKQQTGTVSTLATFTVPRDRTLLIQS